MEEMDPAVEAVLEMLARYGEKRTFASPPNLRDKLRGLWCLASRERSRLIDTARIPGLYQSRHYREDELQEMIDILEEVLDVLKKASLVAGHYGFR